MKKNLPNYFIKKRNMFATVPNHKLLLAQERVKRLKENPVMFILRSFTRLQYEEKFYPMPDIERLYQILTVDNTLGSAQYEIDS